MRTFVNTFNSDAQVLFMENNVGHLLCTSVFCVKQFFFFFGGGGAGGTREVFFGGEGILEGLKYSVSLSLLLI